MKKLFTVHQSVFIFSAIFITILISACSLIQIKYDTELLQKEKSLYDLMYALKESNPVKISASLTNLKKNVAPFLINKIEAKILDYEYDDAIIMLTQIAQDMGISQQWKEMK